MQSGLIHFDMIRCTHKRGNDLTGIEERIITFINPFQSAPELFFTPVKIGTRGDNRYAIGKLEVTQNGFQFELKVWGDSIIDLVEFKWLAIEYSGLSVR